MHAYFNSEGSPWDSRSSNHALLQWDQSQMNRALKSVKNIEMSREKHQMIFGFQEPRATIQDRLYKRVDEASKMGRASLMSHEQETKLIDYACNRAAFGYGIWQNPVYEICNSVCQETQHEI